MAETIDLTLPIAEVEEEPALLCISVPIPPPQLLKTPAVASTIAFATMKARMEAEIQRLRQRNSELEQEKSTAERFTAQVLTSKSKLADEIQELKLINTNLATTNKKLKDDNASLERIYLNAKQKLRLLQTRRGAVPVQENDRKIMLLESLLRGKNAEIQHLKRELESNQIEGNGVVNQAESAIQRLRSVLEKIQKRNQIQDDQADNQVEDSTSNEGATDEEDEVQVLPAPDKEEPQLIDLGTDDEASNPGQDEMVVAPDRRQKRKRRSGLNSGNRNSISGPRTQKRQSLRFLGTMGRQQGTKMRSARLSAKQSK